MTVVIVTTKKCFEYIMLARKSFHIRRWTINNPFFCLNSYKVIFLLIVDINFIYFANCWWLAGLDVKNLILISSELVIYFPLKENIGLIWNVIRARSAAWRRWDKISSFRVTILSWFTWEITDLALWRENNTSFWVANEGRSICVWI